MIFASRSQKGLKAWLAAAVIGAGSIALTAPAEARMGGFGGGFGGFHGGFHGGFRGTVGGSSGFHRPIVFRHPGFASRPFLANRAAFSNRPVFFNRRFAANHPFFFHRRHRFGGAFAAGLVSGAAFGSLGYGSFGYGYPYYSTAAYDEDCYVVRRRVLTPWGYTVVRNRLVCSY